MVFLSFRKLRRVTISFETGKGNPDLPWITPEIETTDRVVLKNRLFLQEHSFITLVARLCEQTI